MMTHLSTCGNATSIIFARRHIKRNPYWGLVEPHPETVQRWIDHQLDKAKSDFWNLWRRLEATVRIHEARDFLLQREGREPSLKSICRQAHADFDTAKAALKRTSEWISLQAVEAYELLYVLYRNSFKGVLKRSPRSEYGEGGLTPSAETPSERRQTTRTEGKIAACRRFLASLATGSTPGLGSKGAPAAYPPSRPRGDSAQSGNPRRILTIGSSGSNLARGLRKPKRQPEPKYRFSYENKRRHDFEEMKEARRLQQWHLLEDTTMQEVQRRSRLREQCMKIGDDWRDGCSVSYAPLKRAETHDSILPMGSIKGTMSRLVEMCKSKAKTPMPPIAPVLSSEKIENRPTSFPKPPTDNQKSRILTKEEIYIFCHRETDPMSWQTLQMSWRAADEKRLQDRGGAPYDDGSPGD